jgi:hypothetical protein
MLYASRFRFCIASALVLPLAGCSIHPLPENHPLNFDRASTFDIVHRVRCEAKRGLESFKGRRSKEHVANIVAHTSIGFDFEFKMTEDSDLTGGGLTVSRGSTSSQPNGGHTVSLSGSAQRKRENIRAFRIIEDLADVAKADCSERPRSNLAYPISGSLRVDEVVRAYIQLERLTDLDDEDRLPAREHSIPFTDGQKSAVFSETLTFKTTLRVGAMPTLTLSAVVGKFRVTSATVHGEAKRDDDHTLIVAFAQSPDFKDENLKARRARADKGKLVGKDRKVVRGARLESALARGSSEHARNRVALELARVRNLMDDERESARFLGKQLLTFMRPPDETGPSD